MKINWVVRFKNKAFWIALIPAVLLLIQQVCRMFGVELALEGLSEQLLAIVESVFAILALFGITALRH